MMTALRLRVSIPFKRESVSERKMQTLGDLLRSEVSIPFKRESVSEPKKLPLYKINPEFQFPSNGKAYLNPVEMSAIDIVVKVSIPFKRESVFRVLKNLAGNSAQLFQFPSNGKAYLNVGATHWQCIASRKVSIPFKRESVSERRSWENSD